MTNRVLLFRPRIGIFLSMVNPPIGLGYLAAYLEREGGYKVDIIDLALRNLTDDDLIRLIEARAPVLVGITALTTYYASMKGLALLIKARLPSVPVVLGGVHASALPGHAIDECRADFVVAGEGEQTLLELVNHVKDGGGDPSHIAGLYFKKDGELFFTGDRPLMDDLDSLPLPAWHKIDPNKYPREPHGFIQKYKKTAPVTTTRGCPFKCTYCASCRFWKQRIRFRDPRLVVDEIELLQREFGIREIHFWDDNLTLRRSHITGICKEIMKRDLKVAMKTPNGVRVDTLDEPLMRLMKAAGFYHLTFAVESGSQKVLQSSKKFTDLKKIARNAFIAKRLGLSLEGFFIIGFPADTPTTIRKTIQYAKSVPFDMKSFFIMKPLPGSGVFDDWAREKDLSDFDWDELNFFDGMVSVNPLGANEIENWHKRAFKETIVRFPFVLHYFFFRFIKHGHAFQFKDLVKRLVFLLFGKKSENLGLNP